MKFTPAIVLLFMGGLSACMEAESLHYSQEASQNSNRLPSAYELGNPFSNAACMIPTRPKAQLPRIFVSPDYYTGSTEVGDERRVSAFKDYFMTLGSRAKVNSNAATELRAVLLDIAIKDRFQWGQGWEENSSNVFYFSASALFPIALEYYHQKERFSLDEQVLIESYGAVPDNLKLGYSGHYEKASLKLV